MNTVVVGSEAVTLLSHITGLPENQATQQQTVWSYQELKKFQEYRQQLEIACEQLVDILNECANRSVLPHTLTEETRKVAHKLRSQRFRVAP